MIQDLFKTKDWTLRQENFLRVMSKITDIKKANGDKVDEYDLSIEKEARDILNGRY